MPANVPAKSNARTREQWAAVINANWRKSIEGIIQTGRDLIAAKAVLPNGQFGKMIDDDLDFGPQTAQQLMLIAAHPAIGKATTSLDFPSSWSVLVQLAQLPQKDFDWAQSRGLISTETTSRGVRALKKALVAGEGEIVRAGDRPEKLPSPKEANRIARETDKAVAASDGNIYIGHTDEDMARIPKEREEDYGLIDGVTAVAKVARQVTPEEWHERAGFRLQALDTEDVDAAINWLSGLYEVLKNGKQAA